MYSSWMYTSILNEYYSDTYFLYILLENSFNITLMYTSTLLGPRCILLINTTFKDVLGYIHYYKQEASLFRGDKLKTWNLSSTCLIFSQLRWYFLGFSKKCFKYSFVYLGKYEKIWCRNMIFFLFAMFLFWKAKQLSPCWKLA